MGRDKRLQVGDHGRVAAESEMCVDAVLEAAEAQLLEPCHLALRKLFGSEVAQRGATPQGERLVERGHGVARTSTGERLPARLMDGFEPVGIELVGPETQRVASRAADDPVRRREGFPDPGDVGPNGLRRGGRRLGAVEILYQPSHGAELTALEKQDGE